MRLFNPADLLAPTKPRSNPALSAGGEVATATVLRPRRSNIKATQGTVRAMRRVRQAAVAKFGRGKTKLEYRQGHWVVHLYNYHGEPVGLYLAYDAPNGGVEGFGVDFQLVPPTYL